MMPVIIEHNQLFAIRGALVWGAGNPSARHQQLDTLPVRNPTELPTAIPLDWRKEGGFSRLPGQQPRIPGHPKTRAQTNLRRELA
ncbi:MAG: hypothetical protein Q9219_001951 [cf. Caloplaca sp. 3 TL-2023]